MRLHCSVIFLMVVMYCCTVAEFFSSCFSYCSAIMATDNHRWIIEYIDTVSPVREQFFRLGQISSQNTTIYPPPTIFSVYACLSNTSKLCYTHYTCASHTSFEILIDFFGL